MKLIQIIKEYLLQFGKTPKLTYNYEDKIAVRSKKKKKNNLTKLRQNLARLKASLFVAEIDSTKAKLVVQIRLAEEKLKIESFHRVTGFNNIRVYEIPSGAPGLGKKK